MSQIRHILTTTDLSDAADPGVSTAAEFAKRMGAKVTLIHVWDPSPLAPLATRGDSQSDQFADEQKVEQAVRAAMDRVVAAKLNGVENAEVHLVEGHNAAEAIVKYADGHDVDLVVLSTHGRTGLAHMLIGSTAERVVRSSLCPVLTVPTRPRT